MKALSQHLLGIQKSRLVWMLIKLADSTASSQGGFFLCPSIAICCVRSTAYVLDLFSAIVAQVDATQAGATGQRLDTKALQRFTSSLPANANIVLTANGDNTFTVGSVHIPEAWCLGLPAICMPLMCV